MFLPRGWLKESFLFKAILMILQMIDKVKEQAGEAFAFEI